MHCGLWRGAEVRERWAGAGPPVSAKHRESLPPPPRRLTRSSPLEQGGAAAGPWPTHALHDGRDPRRRSRLAGSYSHSGIQSRLCGRPVLETPTSSGVLPYHLRACTFFLPRLLKCPATIKKVLPASLRFDRCRVATAGLPRRHKLARRSALSRSRL